MKRQTEQVEFTTTALVAMVLFLSIMLLAVAMGTMVNARDLDGRHADSPLHGWFNHLASGKGLCCSFADGYRVDDADWETTKDGAHYRVRIPVIAGGSELEWVDVPDEAVITEPNRAGKTMVWPMYYDGAVSIRCFMPGTMG